MTVKPDSKKLSPEAQLRAYVDKLDPKNQKLFRSVRAAVRKRFPTANELAYDYSHALASISTVLSSVNKSTRESGKADGQTLVAEPGHWSRLIRELGRDQEGIMCPLVQGDDNFVVQNLDGRRHIQ